MAVAVETRVHGAHMKEQELRNSIVAAVGTLIPQADQKSPDELDKVLKSRLEAQRTASQSSPSRLLTTIAKGSDAVTSKAKASVTNLTYEDLKLKWEGRVTSLKDSEDIRASLESAMTEVEQVRTRPASSNSFVYQIEGKPLLP